VGWKIGFGGTLSKTKTTRGIKRARREKVPNGGFFLVIYIARPTPFMFYPRVFQQKEPHIHG